MSENPDAGPDHVSDAPIQKKGPPAWVIWLSVFGIGGLLVCFLMPVTRSARPAARSTQCKNNLKQIGLALHNYADQYNALPPAYTVDAAGKPLHSWRTLILPYLDQKPLYETIDLSKAWDDPANATACKTRIPAVYQCPEATDRENHTVYLASVAPNGCFRLTQPRQFSDITDGPAETLMVLEAAPGQSVHWMSPQDADESVLLSFGPDSKLDHHTGTHALLCDGRVRFLAADLPAAERRDLITIAGGETIGEF